MKWLVVYHKWSMLPVRDFLSVKLLREGSIVIKEVLLHFNTCVMFGVQIMQS